MTFRFELRTDRPDAAGRCTVYLRAYYEGQRPRFATREKCLPSEWNPEKERFRRSLSGYQDANDYLDSITERLQSTYRKLLTDGKSVTPELLKASLLPAEPAPEPVTMLPIYTEYTDALEARGYRAQTLVVVRTVKKHLEAFEKTRPKLLTLDEYTVAVHDLLLAYLRLKLKLAPNTVAKIMRRLKAFLRYARDERGLKVGIELKAIRAEWVDVDKLCLTAADLAKLENAMLPSSLVATRDAFLFCCYTGLRYSDMRALTTANVHEWRGKRVLRLTQTKTRTALSVYLTAPAAALLDKYAGTRVKLLPATANQVMNRNLKRIAQFAGFTGQVETVEFENSELVKSLVAKWKLVTMHTARHTFATQSLLRGMPVAVLQKVLGHAKIQTTMIYAKIVEDFQHQVMQQIWEGQSSNEVEVSSTVCVVEPAA
ncbi:site-specific integrase [Hymenobacter psychrotolerans]|uniref:Site-specific recombinase XerD n=1 Tax=Hymenobacter psychrotolerans DSM 18569 TaxID=1121959 RepID=A0A1M6USR3_9BACT|nr:site-specific integrase [Hymenobacter psychrotolerans]SHK72223.1 Site-specific recombinase XerD [Hymenobacter psychrotolerans DSM 18569]